MQRLPYFFTTTGGSDWNRAIRNEPVSYMLDSHYRLDNGYAVEIGIPVRSPRGRHRGRVDKEIQK